MADHWINRKPVPRKPVFKDHPLRRRPLRGTALREAFLGILAEHDRVAIVGGPKTGKSTLSGLVTDRPVFGTDILIGVATWADAPHAFIGTCTGVPRFVAEGVQVARALRKGLKVDCVIGLREPKVELNDGQARMTKGIWTVMRSFDLDAPIVFLT